METKKLIKEFVKIDYKGFGCVMYMIEKFDVIVFFEHWKYVNWSDAPKVYLGKQKKIKQLKPTYLWQD